LLDYFSFKKYNSTSQKEGQMSHNWGALLIQILKFFFEKNIFFWAKFYFERKFSEKHSLIMNLVYIFQKVIRQIYICMILT
jgi:thiamine transporter ThiT